MFAIFLLLSFLFRRILNMTASLSYRVILVDMSLFSLFFKLKEVLKIEKF